MATKAKNGTFRFSIKNTYHRAKSNAQRYAAEIKRAYKRGYVSGWKDRENVPMSFGCRQSAVMGYSNGLRDHGQVISSQKRFHSRQK